MEIYIGKAGQVLGPYYPDEIQKRLDADLFDGTEKAWHDGLDEWVNVKELLEDDAHSQEAEDEPVPEAEEPSVETESAQESEPLDEETWEQVNKIKGLIGDGHVDTAWQLVQSLNDPRIYEGLLEGCPVADEGCPAGEDEWGNAPAYLEGHADLLIKLLGKLPEGKIQRLTELYLRRSKLTEVPKGLEKLTQLKYLNLTENQLTDVKGLEKLAKLTGLWLDDNQISDVSALKGLTQLKYLILDENQLTDVKGLEKLDQLTSLNLSGNQLTDVKGLEKLDQLMSLNLSGNQLTEVPKGLEKLDQLTSLSLDENQLTDVKGLEKLTKLERLYIHHNPDLTKAQIDRLQKALPKCKIRSNPKK